MDQINIFELLSPAYKIKKPIRLIELFAGYGSQALALKYLGVPFEHWKISEWCWKSTDAYNRIHYGDTTDYSREREKDWLIEYLFDKGISKDWNKPMTYEQIKKLPEHQLRKIYNDIQATRNLVNIQKITAKDLELNDDGYTYLMTYSFPCQDLSLAGLRGGMNKDSGTRSGLLWEVDRLLKECKELGRLPDVLLMENVPQVHGVENSENFKLWQLELEKLGYTSYWQDLIATDYGIPQIRNRTFMISLLGDYYYSFPKPIPLEKKLKDLLEPEVDEKFYLSDVAIQFLTNNNEKMIERGNGFRWDVKPEEEAEIAKTLTCNSGYRMDDNFIEIKRPHGYFPGSVKEADTISTIDASINFQHIVLGEPLKIKNATKKGYLEADEGDCVDIGSRMETHRGTVQKQVAQTITTMGGGERGVVTRDSPKDMMGG